MPTVTLCEKFYAKMPLKNVETHLQSICEGLLAKVKIVEITDRRWIRVNISGEDETAASNLLEQRFEFAPIEFDYAELGSIRKGKILSSQREKGKIRVDFGVLLPQPVDACLSEQYLRAQLVDGEKMPLRQIAHLYCLVDHFPLNILIKRYDDERKCFLAELGHTQLSLFQQWNDENLERLVVLGAFHEDVEKAAKASGHLRDVAEIESLGLLEHAVVCKLGTEAAGLIPRFGRLLSSAVLRAYSPRQIQRAIRALR